jgi:hypothetical protein
MAAPYFGWYVVAACATIACFSWGFALLLVILLPLVAFVIKPAPTDPSPAGGRGTWPGGAKTGAPARQWRKCSPSPACSGVGHYEAPAFLYLRGNCGPSGRRPS